MSLNLLIQLGARMRCLSEDQFVALKALIQYGDENRDHLPAVADCLEDMTQMSDAFNAEPKLRLVPA